LSTKHGPDYKNLAACKGAVTRLRKRVEQLEADLKHQEWAAGRYLFDACMFRRLLAERFNLEGRTLLDALAEVIRLEEGEALMEDGRIVLLKRYHDEWLPDRFGTVGERPPCAWDHSVKAEEARDEEAIAHLPPDERARIRCVLRNEGGDKS